MKPLKHLPAWKTLEQHFKDMRAFDMRSAFREDAHRFEHLSLRCGNLLLDYSKNRVTTDTMQHLIQLARESDLEGMRNAMFSGERINFTERRAVLHTALRAPVRPPLVVEGVDVEREVAAVLRRMQRFVESIHNGGWRGHTGKPIRDVVNIGIGGSDLGPAMVCSALDHYALESVRVHFVSNLDPAHLAGTLKQLDPETTLFIVASKTFTTQKRWPTPIRPRPLLLRYAPPPRCAALRGAVDHAQRRCLGIDPDNMFIFWDGVGGRYSLCRDRPSIALQSLGNFQALLAAPTQDIHFRRHRWKPSCRHPWHARTVSQLLAPTPRHLPHDHACVNWFRPAAARHGSERKTSPRQQAVNYNTAPSWGRPGHHAARFSNWCTRHAADSDRLSAAAVNPTPLADQHECCLPTACAYRSVVEGKSRAGGRSRTDHPGMGREPRVRGAAQGISGNPPSNTLLYQSSSHTLA